jgi:acyl-CoA synthetase (AMP-forming)/AMP-acid ligase II
MTNSTKGTAMITSAFQALMQRAQDRPKNAAFVFRDKTWTYEMIASEAEHLAHGMAARGVKSGDRVALHMMNRPEYIVAYYACFRLGAIAAPLRTAFTLAELTPILQRLKPALYIGETNLYGNVAPISASVLPRDRRFIVGAACQREDGVPWEKLLDSAGNDNSVAPAAYEPAVLITTSGTTGEPKFVVHSASTLAETIELWVENLELFDDDVIAVPLALAHASGLFSVLCYMQLGARLCCSKALMPTRFLTRSNGTAAFFHIGFPAQYAQMLECQRLKPRNLRSLRFCLTGGDACPIDLQQQVTSAFGAPLHNFWASTEAAGNLTFGLRPGPVARIVEGTQVRLVDEKGCDVADGEIGELLLRGPNVFDGYWNDPQATAGSLKGGWYRTGDLMRHGGGEELIFVARKKDIIIRGGTNISPIEVEQAIVGCHPAVEEAAVVGMPDVVLGQRVIGFIKLAKGANEAVVSEIVDNLTTRLAAYKIPERFIVLDALPRNALSKIDRKALQIIADDLGNVHQPQSIAALAPPRPQNERRSRHVQTR